MPTSSATTSNEKRKKKNISLDLCHVQWSSDGGETAREHEKGFKPCVDVCLIAAKRITVNKKEEKEKGNSLINPILLENIYTTCLCVYVFIASSYTIRVERITWT